MSTYKEVDTSNWPRVQHCEIFRHMEQPQYSVSFELDATRFYKKIKKNHWSFTFSFIYLIAKAADEIPEFRYRFLDGKVVIYEGINAAFTYLNQETGLIKNLVCEIPDSLEEFLVAAKKVNEEQKVYFTGPMGADTYQFSAIPWISFTHISHTYSGDREGAVPMFDWGKLYKKGRKWMLPFSIQAHHSFVDGLHMGQLAELLQKRLDEF